MVTLAICWKAIGAIVLMAVILVVVGLFVVAVLNLTESNSTVLRVLGWIIWIVIVCATLLGVYFAFAKELCG